MEGGCSVRKSISLCDDDCMAFYRTTSPSYTGATILQVNAWGDQPTLEMVRLIVEWGGFCFLDKDKRGDFKVS